MAHYNFKRDLAQSKTAVEIVKQYFTEDGADEIEELQKESQHKGDILVIYKAGPPDKWIKLYVEVKYDIYAARSGNLCFETSNGKKPTGIYATEAEVIHYVVPYEDHYTIFMFDAEELREYLATSTKVVKKRGGDKKRFEMDLVSISDLTDDCVAYRINTIWRD